MTAKQKISNVAKPRCKAGDLAIIINAHSKVTHNIGKIVRVVRFAEPDEYLDEIEDIVWMVKSEGGTLLQLNQRWAVEYCRERPMRDVDLFPIRPQASNNEKRKKKESTRA